MERKNRSDRCCPCQDRKVLSVESVIKVLTMARFASSSSTTRCRVKTNSGKDGNSALEI